MPLNKETKPNHIDQILKPFKSDEQDMQDTVGEVGASS